MLSRLSLDRLRLSVSEPGTDPVETRNVSHDRAAASMPRLLRCRCRCRWCSLVRVVCLGDLEPTVAWVCLRLAAAGRGPAHEMSRLAAAGRGSAHEMSWLAAAGRGSAHEMSWLATGGHGSAHEMSLSRSGAMGVGCHGVSKLRPKAAACSAHNSWVSIWKRGLSRAPRRFIGS
jgi:hypothetical protein